MDLYTTRDLPYVRETLRQRLLQGEVAILPTDTIYGLSGNALDPKVVARILEIKGRSSPPAVIPHSLEWARLLVDEEHVALFDAHIGEYRGAYLTLWRYSGRHANLPAPLHASGLVGLRQPDHWISDLAASARIPLVTTSVNRHLHPAMTCLDDLHRSIREHVDFMVYEGPRSGPPSTIVHCYEGLPFRLAGRP